MAEQHEIDAAFEGIFDNTGVTEQDPAEPAPETEETSAQADEDNAEGDDTGDGAGQQDPTEPEGQSAEENAKYAAARRKAEQQAAREIQRIRDEEAQRTAAAVNAAIADMGLENPYTGKPITTKEELNAYRDMHAQYQHDAVSEKLNESGLTAEEKRALVEGDPQYVAAMKLKADHEALQKKVNNMEAQQLKERADARLAAGIAAIHEEDPAINSVQDLFEHPKFSEIDALVSRGASLEQAYMFVNQEAIIQRKAEAMAAQMRNNIAGKNHMGSTTQRGDGGFAISSEALAEFQALNPGLSVDQIRAFAEKDAKRMKNNRK